MQCAHAVREVACALGPIRFAIGHSIGGLALLVTGEGRHPMPCPDPFEAYVLVAMPDRFADVTRRFGDEWALSPVVLQAFEGRLEQLAQRTIADFTGSRLLATVGRPTLLVHARDDQEVPFADAERLMAVGRATELQSFEGFGHRTILYAPPVVRAASAFLARFR
jgi:pimeloyl-ACP methyl ester carboxylesterase